MPSGGASREKGHLGSLDPGLGGYDAADPLPEPGTIGSMILPEPVQELLRPLSAIGRGQRPGLFHDYGNFDQVVAVTPAVEAERAVVEHLGGLGGEREPTGPDQGEQLLPDGRNRGLGMLGLRNRTGKPAQLRAEGAIRNFFGVTI